jgi:hypothetical protein
VVGLDVGGDGLGEEVGAGVAGFQAVAEACGGNFLVDGLEEVDAGALVRGEEAIVQVVEREAGAAYYDPFG